MILIYITFFIILNFSIFMILKKEMTRKLLMIFSIIILSFLSLHFFVFHEKYLSNDSFLHLISFSFAILVFYFGSKIPISSLKKKIDFDKHLVGIIFNTIRIYLVPAFVTISQINFLIFRN